MTTTPRCQGREHALDWIAREGKFRRFIGASELRDILDRPRRHCTWCGEPVSVRRQTWCSDKCLQDFLVRCRYGRTRVEVKKRDDGCCSKCGEQVERWEMDHIVPVEEGGGLCTIDNLRTLCVPCHKPETTAHAGRRARRRRSRV